MKTFFFLASLVFVIYQFTFLIFQSLKHVFSFPPYTNIISSVLVNTVSSFRIIAKKKKKKTPMFLWINEIENWAKK
jgi:hypothetical protein